MTRSGWINAGDLLSERAQLRAEVTRLRAENERLRSALVEEVLAEVQGGRGPCDSRSVCLADRTFAPRVRAAPAATAITDSARGNCAPSGKHRVR